MWKKLVVSAIGARNALLLQQAMRRSLRAITGPRPVSSFPVSGATLFSEPHEQVFFGYYDISPFSSDGKYILATHTLLGNVSPAPRDELVVGYYILNESNQLFVEIGRTTTWCWQQGCRLQWYPSQSSEHVLYNRLVNDQYGCAIQNIHSKETIREYPRPIYCISQDGQWGLSLDFSRLQRLRPGYGYTTLLDTSAMKSVPRDNGIWRIDMKTGDERLLVSLKDIATLASKPSIQIGDHYFNHLCFNPEGNRFMFFHLCERNGKRSNRLLTSGIDGQDIHLLENEKTVSHYAWKTNTELLATTFHPDIGFQYILYDDASGRSYVLSQDVLKQDGHPSYFPDLNYILTDTYPDKCGECNILIYEDKNKALSRLASFYSPIDFSGEARCDLHPRLNKGGSMVCADVVHRSRRAMWVCRLCEKSPL
jgi:hypothetical protein